MGNPQVHVELASASREQQLIDGLVRHRFSVIENYLSPRLTAALYRELHRHHRLHRLHPAHIGKARHRMRIPAIRGDSIHWLDGESAAQRAFLFEMEHLRQLLNQQLFLGLTELEAHFAYFPPGTGYRTHLDNFHNSNLRRISCTAYLNPAWRQGDGGELLLYDDEAVIASVPPVGGTLACFLSEEIPHQVAVTRAGRASIAGWFRVREIGTYK
jgi:SM-20-related protein